MKLRSLLIIILFVACVTPASAQKKNGKVAIETEKGGVEKGKIKNGRREGTWKTYNSKGHQIQEEHFLNGKRSGSFWREVDSLTMTGTYLAGSKNGRFTTTINGRVVSEIDYRMDTLHGRYYVATDEKKIVGEYDHGKKSGLRVVDSVEFNFQKPIKDSCYFVNGLRDGAQVVYQNGVRISEIHWQQGKRNGWCRKYDPVTGELILSGNYVDDDPDGEWRSYRKGKLYFTEDYELGVHAANTIQYGDDTTIIEAVTSYHPNGETRLVVRYREGKVYTRWFYNGQSNLDSAITYYPTGRVQDALYTSYTNDDGETQFYLYMSYHANGKLKSKGYKHRMAEAGTWLMYDSLGKQQASMSYDEGVPFGAFKAYHPNGKMKLQAYCYEGVTDTILVYDKNGTRVAQSNPNYSKTIAEIQAQYPEINFRDPNNFPPDHKRKGIVCLGDSIRGEGKWSDIPAMYPGGNDSLNAFIKRIIHYPEPERRLSKEGEVRIKFLVEKDGTLSDIQIDKEVAGAPGFTKETMRLMRAMPKWTPARTKGKIVRVYYTLPVRFYLQ